MSAVEQSEAQASVAENDPEETEAENSQAKDAEKEKEVHIEPAENKDDAAQTMAATSAESSANDTLDDTIPHAAGLEQTDRQAAEPEAAEVPGAEDAAADAEAEPHTAKVLTEEARHEACLPGCLQAKSVSPSSTPKAVHMSGSDTLVAPENTSDVSEAVQQDHAVTPPMAQAVDDRAANDDAVACDHPDKLAAAERAGLSKESTEEGKAGSCSDADTNPSDQDQAAESQSQDTTPCVESAPSVKSFQVLAVPPQDLFFVAPPGCKPGQLVWIQGPHGPLQVTAPADVKPGKRVAVRLAAPFQHEVVVPAGAKPGDTVTFKGENDKQLQAVVPPGRQPGQAFHVSPPATMLRIPDGAVAGDQLLFKIPVRFGPDGSKIFQEFAASVPPNMAPGRYFAAGIDDIPQTPDQAHGEVCT